MFVLQYPWQMLEQLASTSSLTVPFSIPDWIDLVLFPSWLFLMCAAHSIFFIFCGAIVPHSSLHLLYLRGRVMPLISRLQRICIWIRCFDAHTSSPLFLLPPIVIDVFFLLFLLLTL
ncbi:hypothetical protein BJ742DRAFT_407934 [Cladochytrium replicatum]|nr:hypothetical protein BJ742DRAFT_407934 [Cladochytrium replicatum]